MSTCRYRPLQNTSETRLLEIEQASHYSDEIICRLIHISLVADTPSYEALSYVWNNSSNSWTSEYNWSPPKIKFAFYPPLEGEEVPGMPSSYDEEEFEADRKGGEIVCDGQKVVVGAELFDALRRIRLPDRQRSVWIDALCINQQNVNERNMQVRNMRDIYSRADHVLIWVGERFSSGSASQSLLDFIKELEMLIMMIMETYGSKNRKGIEKALSQAYISHLIRWSFLRELLSRAWFGRVWVLQEVIHAKKATIYAGSAKCDWDTIAAITRWLSIYDVMIFADIRENICALTTVDMIWKLSKLKDDPRHPPLPRLLDVLAQSRLCKSTFAIDKVYGILGLVCDEDARSIPIDYRINAEDLYQKIAVSELSRTGLDILYYSTKPAETSTVACPSWVPDWSKPCYHDSYAKLGYSCSAAGSSAPQFRVEGAKLIVKGSIVDTLQAVELMRAIPAGTAPDIEPEKRNETEVENKMQSTYVVPLADSDVTPADQTTEAELDTSILKNSTWFPNIMKIAFPDGTITADSYEALWRTCCCNRTIDGKVPGLDFADSFADWTKAMMGLKLRDFEEFQRKARRLMESFSRYCNNRRFFRSRDGRYGWGPDQTRDGDVICVLEGAVVPFILRPVGDDCFEIIGDAYVYGIMDGEAMELGFEAKDIVLV